MNGLSAGNVQQLVRRMPKVELHLHIEGAIPVETLFSFIRRTGSESSVNSLDDLRRRLTYTDFKDFIEAWTWKNSFVTQETDFEEIAHQVLSDLSRQNVKYVEAFYSPGDYAEQGLSAQGITECLIRGKEKAYRDFGVRCELIVDLIRGLGVDTALRTLEEVTPYLGTGVIGIGLGGSEERFPPDPYARIYREAGERGFRLTAHAGEAAGADSIWAAIEKLGIERIGHGVRANEDPELVSFLRERQIPLEMCVTSNVMTGVCSSVESHPLKEYFDHGLLVTVNSDDPTMFNTSITQEYLLLVQELAFSVEDLRTLTLNGVEASFMADEDKEIVRSQFEQAWQELLRQYG